MECRPLLRKRKGAERLGSAGFRQVTISKRRWSETGTFADSLREDNAQSCQWLQMNPTKGRGRRRSLSTSTIAWLGNGDVSRHNPKPQVRGSDLERRSRCRLSVYRTKKSRARQSRRSVASILRVQAGRSITHEACEELMLDRMVQTIVTSCS